MSIRISSVLNAQPFEAFNAYLDNFNEIVERAGREVYETYKPVILQRLQADPGPVKYPVEFTRRPDGERRQQKAFFASNGFGRGIGAPRTGALQAEWDVLFVQEAGSFRILITNPSSASKFVYGGLSLRSNPRFQQQMHKATGWPAAAPIVDIYLDAMRTEFLDRMKQELSDFGSVTGGTRRAFTGR